MKIRPFYALLIALTLLIRPAQCHADGEDASPEDIMKGVLSSFELPLSQLIEKKHKSERRNLFDGFSGQFSVIMPLNRAELKSKGSGQTEPSVIYPVVTASLRYVPLGNWFIYSTFYHYIDGKQSPWEPDFSYIAGYSDWRPYALSLTYANYGPNRLNPDRRKGEHFTRLANGTFTLSWNLTLPKKLQDIFILHPSGGVSGNLSYLLTPKYEDTAGATDHWKHTLTLNIKYTVYKWVYLSYSMRWYPQDSKQQPWDPDVTYDAGYFNWQPGTANIRLINYGPTRYPWRSHQRNWLKDAGVSLSWSWAL